MLHPSDKGKLTTSELLEIIGEENQTFKEHYLWLEKGLNEDFFKEMTHEELLFIIHHLVHFKSTGFFTQISLQQAALVVSLDEKDSDIKILKLFENKGIKTFRSFISLDHYPKTKQRLKITKIHFTTAENSSLSVTYEEAFVLDLFNIRKKIEPLLDFEAFKKTLSKIPKGFMSSFSQDQLNLVLDLYYRAESRDHCQYYIESKEPRNEKKPQRMILAWKNTPKSKFLYKIAKAIYRHDLKMNDVNIATVENAQSGPILLISFKLEIAQDSSHAPDIDDFVKEVVTLKYFNSEDRIEDLLVDKKWITGNEGNLLRCFSSLIHQTLLHIDLNLYSFQNVQEAFCRHPELTERLVELFNLRFDPKKGNQTLFAEKEKVLLKTISELDTGQELYDKRRKEIFKHSINLISHILKTNFFRKNKSAFSFRLNPSYLNLLPTLARQKFPELPYGIFFIQGMHFISFHIRFKDISRGGLRSIIPKKYEQLLIEKNNIFTECYNLAYTQQKKNKDIPEGGSKAVILLDSMDLLDEERQILKQELLEAHLSQEKIEELLAKNLKERQKELLYSAQRAFVHSLITLTNTSDDHELRAKDIIDYYKKPEYIYLGPDENMSNEMLEWIANHSVTCHYPLGKAFISSKPSCGINHKEYGVTSLGVNVYMEEVLEFLEINPHEDCFTVKMTGGPDGDVAGNQIFNLYRFYEKTARLLTLIDGSGVVYDPKGLDLKVLAKLFKEGKSISYYPTNLLSHQGFLLNTLEKKEESAFSQKTLLTEKKDQTLVENWITSSQMNSILRHHVHQTKADIFITAGGRPRTLNQENVDDFLDKEGKPTAKAIVEGANLYLTQEAREQLEKKGVLIIKDSSANKGGVICSSLEVLTALTMPEEDFLKYKEKLMPQILDHIKNKAKDEAKLLLKTYAETGIPLTKISEMISEKINQYTYEILGYLEDKKLSHELSNPLMLCLIDYCLPFLRKNYKESIIHKIPDIHQKAMIACYIASNLVYSKGVFWAPSIIDILPLISKEITAFSQSEYL